MYATGYAPSHSLARTPAATSLLAAVSRHDIDTQMHLFQVAALCESIARALDLDERTTTLATDGGLFHDLGKLRIPVSILRAPRALTPIEWTIVKEHPATGVAIAERVFKDRELLDVIANHHENLDGTGYPRGLDATAISMATRIVSVADAYDVMRSGRVYHPKRLTHNEVLVELVRHAGTRYDPDVVRAMRLVPMTDVLSSELAEPACG